MLAQELHMEASKRGRNLVLGIREEGGRGGEDTSKSGCGMEWIKDAMELA